MAKHRGIESFSRGCDTDYPVLGQPILGLSLTLFSCDVWDIVYSLLLFFEKKKNIQNHPKKSDIFISIFLHEIHNDKPIQPRPFFFHRFFHPTFLTTCGQREAHSIQNKTFLSAQTE